ncbi:peptidase [Thiomicrorhabdus immobilis]|uniref:Penicillin-binding protein 1A n=1 Tax=Thiomicrorhabdus immobilis TaxID=2791037 RepID=A0ABM7MFK8_9GAMM|nr:penicillin-binding protein 1A [Thiomicrorhabdus immobilis]BCN94297.1 peptidase [Thiomicrorhabdus immobilis]
MSEIEVKVKNDAAKEVNDPQPSQQNLPPKKKRRWFLWLFAFNFISFTVLAIAAATFYYITVYPTLPDTAELKEVSYQVPLRIVTQDDKLISEIGTKKRLPLEYSEIPERMTQAIISSEDESFFEHGGVDYKGLARAVVELITTGQKKSGGSTITMQVARNFFLSKEKTYLRKLNEIILSYKIENDLSKQEILALYLNKIFLGYRSYGVAAAAQTYYGRSINELTLDEYAMIAGLPKAPSAYNPIANPSRAKLRRNYVLRRMHDLNFITEEEMLAAQAVEVHADKHAAIIDVEADYVAEMARAFALEKFGEEALQNGLTIVTSIDSKLQAQANLAVRDGLQHYERRHGYRGPITNLDLTTFDDEDKLLEELKDTSNYGDLQVAVVTGFEKTNTQVLMENGEKITLPFEKMTWAAEYKGVNHKGKDPKKPQDVLKQGDVIYLQWFEDQWQLAQDPKTESALISLDSKDGRILALVGGYDFFRSKFNRVTQGRRQVGSNIKPFLYSAGLENGMTAATTINDAPVVFHDRNLEDVWRPENYSGRFYGPTRLRNALAFSRNLVSIRLLQKLGIDTASDYIQRFGFPEEEINKHRDLSLSLGSVQFTPWEVARAYAAFSNTGYLIEPYYISEVRAFDGEVLYKAEPKIACTNNQCIPGDERNAPRIIEERNVYIMDTIMQDVIRIGSAKKARELKREDIAGKTGTTNDQKDAWFSGFNSNIVTTVWVGFDSPTTLGRSEVGGRASLPIWMEYMQLALQPYPNVPFTQPEGLVNIPIDRETGQAVPRNTPGALMEIFREENAPEIPSVSQKQIEAITEDLFD